MQPTFHRLIEQHALSYPHRTATVCGVERIGYPELARRVKALSRALASAGVTEGGRVMWLGQNSHRTFEVLMACSRLGAALCPVNWRQTAEELCFVLEDFRPQVVFWQEEELGDLCRAARHAARLDAAWFVHDGYSEPGYEQLVAAAATTPAEVVEPRIPPDERSLLTIYTSAFGGRPSGAQISESGLFLQSLTHAAALGIGLQNVGLVSTPMFHIVAWLDLLPTLIMGGTTVITRRAKAEDLCRIIHEEKVVTGRVHAPTAIQMAEINHDRRYDFSRLRSNLAIAGWSEMTSRGAEIGGCGQTEVAGPIVLASLTKDSRLFRGRIAPIAEARVADAAGREVAPGGTGQLLIRGPVAGLGYWNRPDLNAQRWVDGWWHTRDLVRRETDGSITFLAPIARMLKSAAENIYPAEVEAALTCHPAVEKAAIIGVRDPVWTQRVVAIVQRRPGQAASAEDLVLHVRKKIAAYKAPREIHFVDELPMRGQEPDYEALDAIYDGGNYPGQLVARAGDA